MKRTTETKKRKQLGGQNRRAAGSLPGKPKFAEMRSPAQPAEEEARARPTEELYVELEREAAAFFALVAQEDREETAAFQQASLHSLARE